MFSTKIYVLSVFVFCLFNLGQAAPVIDEVSPLSTRELSSLDARGFLEFFGIKKKLDKVTQKHVDTVSINAECQLYKIYSKSQKKFDAIQKSMTGEMADAIKGKSTKEKKPVQDEYKKRTKNFTRLAKEAGKKADDHKKKLEKLGVKDVKTQCPSRRTTSKSDSHSTHQDSHSSQRDSHSSQRNSLTSHPDSQTVPQS